MKVEATQKATQNMLGDMRQNAGKNLGSIPESGR